MLKAYDKTNGHVIADVELPAPPSGTPMTYMAAGKQFIVVATYDGKLVALSLPSNNVQAASAGAKRPPVSND